MGVTEDSFINKKGISVSRNRPLALVVGAAGFLGSHVVDELLAKNIQVIGLDDLSSGSMGNLEIAVKDKDFHFIHQSIAVTDYEALLDELVKDLPRLDYVFWTADSKNFAQLYGIGMENFLRLIELFRKSPGDEGKLSRSEADRNHPRVVMVSSIDLYGNELSSRQKALKSAEIKFAKFVKDNGLNGRIVRLAGLYGPRMNFSDHDPISRLLYAKVLGRLEEESTAMSFSSRALAVGDAVHLVLKSVLTGGTAQKIYDGALLHPLKVTDLKRVIMDPAWYQEHGFEPEILPPWPTPNLEKTMEELSWRPKADLFKTIEYTLGFFKKHEVPKVELAEVKEVERDEVKPFYEMEMSEERRRMVEGFKGAVVESEEEEEMKSAVAKAKAGKGKKWGKNLWWLALWAVVIYALIYPLAVTAFGAVMIKNNLKGAVAAMETGDFNQAERLTQQSEESLAGINQTMGWFEQLAKMGVLKQQIEGTNRLLAVSQDGLKGAQSSVKGVGALYQIGKIISGEDGSDPKPKYQAASIELQTAREKLAKVSVELKDPTLTAGLPELVRTRVSDFGNKLDLYLTMVEKAQAAAAILPQVTAVDGQKSYLVLLQNNMELRPTGGFIGSYAKLDFENGRIKNIKVDDIYNLDGNLKEQVTPPTELKNDLGQNYWYLRDSNWEPDFPTAARQAEFFYNKEAGERVNGVIAMDLSASAKLLSAVGGLNLNEYGEQVNGNNLFERAISHSEANFFPGSQAKKNYLTTLENQLFNKIFFLSKQNWPGIIMALNDSLEEKHLQVYLGDPTLFSYVTAAGWGGVMPRESTEATPGRTNDFLAVVEANMGANKANFYLQRSNKLTTVFGKDGLVYHNLAISYTNNSPSEVFPAGKYKDRVRFYLPAGAKVTKVTFGGEDITATGAPFTDYGRSGYSILVEVAPKQQKTLQVFWQLAKPLNFTNSRVTYRLDVLKQAGTERDPFDWQLTYPINYKLIGKVDQATATEQELNISTNLSVDRSFEAVFSD